MKISVIGAGYVGLVSGAGLASLGHDVACIDVDEGKVAQVNSAKAPFFEEGLDGLLGKVVGARKLTASEDYSSVSAAEAILICVGTPSRGDGSVDLSFVNSAAAQIGKALASSKLDFPAVAVKSTVVPGTTRALIPVLERESGRKAGRHFGVGMVPEFLREGSAVEDFFKPDRIVVGALDGKSASVLKEMHSGLQAVPLVQTTLETAEMIKYASNSFLATKIGFVNELSRACERMGMNVDDVVRGMGLDSRISPHFLKAGPGWGGSCFGKDVKAIVSAQKSIGLRPKILEAVLESNEEQKKRMVSLLEESLGSGLKGRRIAVLGLAFKAGTDDVRDSPAIAIVRELDSRGANAVLYDPQAMQNFKKLFPDATYATSLEGALEGADACLIVTEWTQFAIPGVKFVRLMKNPTVVDSRRILDRSDMKNAGVKYRAVGVGA